MNLYPKYTHPFWESVDCPDCGSKAGNHCFMIGISANMCHRDRYILAVKMGFGLKGNIYLPPHTSKPKPKAKYIGTGERIKHPDGWISGNCVRGSHHTCFSLQCSCECHKDK